MTRFIRPWIALGLLVPLVSMGASKERWKMPAAPEGVSIEKDLTYLTPDRAEKLDLYQPTTRAAGVKSPAIVIIHGGGWTSGDKGAQREFITGTTLALAGYVCVSVEYCKTGQRWPTNLLDCKNAVRWLRVNAGKFAIDPDRIGVIGGSAGGHLALMVAYTSGEQALEPTSPYPGVSDRVSACVDMYGPANLISRHVANPDGSSGPSLHENVLVKASREDAPEAWKLTSPIFHITKDSPPTLIIHGEADTTVVKDQSLELDQALAAAGIEHRLRLVPKAGHGFALQTKDFDLRMEVVAFFDQHLKSRK
jgi:acetyl esterase/lipase